MITLFTISSEVFGILLISLTLVSLMLHFMRIKMLKEKLLNLTERNQELHEQLSAEKEEMDIQKQENIQLLQTVTKLESEYKNLRIRYDEYVNDHRGMQEKFENLAQKILQEKTEKFDVEHRKGIQEILQPLKEKIRHFEEKVEKTHREGLEKQSALKEQINHLKELNEKMSLETNNLTKALRGDVKTQGNWGELILETILEKSGLEKGREYFIQESHSLENGQRLRPDVVIHLPRKKRLIIDAKVSLTAYDKLVNAPDKSIRENMLKTHYISVKQHVDQLSAKNYPQLYQIESPDFVLMFIPMDHAFSAALAHESNLYAYAFDKNIVIVTPSTLLATLKTVESMWRNEKQQKFALDIAAEAGKMYDKFVAFVGDLEMLGKRIDQTKNAYQDSLRKLSYGKGDLISRAQKIKALGAKTTKSLES